MNLFWLKYVSYAFLAGAAVCYFALRMSWRAPGRIWKLGLYTACIVLACVIWHMQESNAQQHSPRKLIIGTIAWVNTNVHKGGSVEYDFQLKIGGALSPKFSTEYVGDSNAKQGIHDNDTLGVLYRTWDNVPLTIDELEGQHPGWHYSRYDDGGSYIFAVALAGSVALLGMLIGSKYGARQTYPSESTRLNLND